MILNVPVHLDREYSQISKVIIYYKHTIDILGHLFLFAYTET